MTQHVKKWSPKTQARLAGVFEALEGLTSAFGQVNVLGGLTVVGNAAATATNILAHQTLLRLVFASSLFGVMFHLGWAFLFYQSLKPVNRSVSFGAVFVILVGCAIQAGAAKEDFTKSDARYDLILDLVGNHSFSKRRHVLTPNGICVLGGIGGAGWHPESWGRVAGNFWAALLSTFTHQKFVTYIAKITKNDLTVLRDLMQEREVSPVIDRTYKLSKTAEAVRYLDEGRAGKLWSRWNNKNLTKRFRYELD